MLITLEQGPPCCYLVRAENDQTLLVQSDYEYPSLASVFGWIACPFGDTDGTIDCPHRTASEMISDAREWLDARIGDAAEDPGYF